MTFSRKKSGNNWILHHGNTSCHASLTVQQFPLKNQIPAILQPPYSPDIAVYNFWLFPSFKTGLKGKYIAFTEAVQHTATKSSWPYQKRRCRSVPSNVRTAAASVCVQKGSTSGVTRLDFIHILFTTNYA
jgi:hypothetical protein